MPSKLLTLAQLQQRLQRAIDDAGSQDALAATYGLTPAYLSQVLHGYRPPSRTLLQHLGCSRVVRYRVEDET